MNNAAVAAIPPEKGVQLLTVGEEREGQRIDNFLITELKDVPKSRIYRLLRKGEIRVNKKRAKPTYRIRGGDIVRLPPLRRAAQRSSPATLSNNLAALLRAAVVMESEELLVLNKPSGLAVHGGSGLSLGVIEALRLLYPQERSLELVHRLDRDTSGCLLISKKRSVLRDLHAQLQAGTIEKTYLALVQGKWPSHVRQVDAPLRKNELQSGERMVNVHEQGKAARTLFRVRQYFANCTLLEVKPVTGRTHQIRVHALHAGHPVAGDDKYGNRDFNEHMRRMGVKRLFLHAESLQFTLPGNVKPVNVVAELQDNLAAPLAKLADNAS